MSTSETPEEHKRRYAREYRAANADKLRESKRAWLEENRKRHNSTNREGARHRKEEAVKTEERRRKDRERAKAWAAKNPERVREQRKAWNERNADRRREIARNYHHRHRDERLAVMREQNAERRRDPTVTEQRRQYVNRNRVHLNELQRARREANREEVNRQQRERKRIEKRRIELGLPKIPRHRSLKNDKREHQLSAEYFFRRRRTAEQKRALRREREGVELSAHRARIGADNATSHVGDKVLRAFLAHKFVSRTVDRYLLTAQAAQLREEVRMDLIARRARGGELTDRDLEVRRRATNYCVKQINERLQMKMYIPKRPVVTTTKNHTRAAEDISLFVNTPRTQKSVPRVL